MVDGVLSVETPDQVYRVERGQVFVAEPKSPHRAYNDADADEAVTVLGLGAPPGDDGHAYEE